ncbi:MAG: fibronectin type III domain-containing protein [Armatimonadota bacterium]
MPGDATNLTLTYPDGTVYLNWTAPTTNVDGSPLDDPQEFRIYRSTTFSLQTGANPTVDAATLAAKFTQYDTVEWGTMNPRSYNDTASFPARSVTSYVVVTVDAADQTSPGPYEVVQLSLMPPSQQVIITPGLLLAKAGDAAKPLVATVLGSDNEPLPDIPVTLTCSPTTAGSLCATIDGTYSQQIEIVTDDTGTATFYWKPPTNPDTASDIGTITAVITGTSISYVVYMSIQPPQPTGYETVESVSLAINQGQPSRIYFSQDVDDLLSDATVISSVLMVTGRTATGGTAPYGRVKLNTDRGGFEKMAVDQVVSADRRSIVGVLDENGRMYVRFIGRVDNGITDPFIRLPLNNELGNPLVTAEDTYSAGTFPISGSVPQLVGPPYRLAVRQGTTSPATPAGWPTQNDQLPVIFQTQTTTAEATVTDRLGQPVLQGMPIWFTQTWRPFNPALDPYDYNGALGHGNISGAYSGPVSLTDESGIARAGFSSNHSGAYDVRAFALLKTFNISVLNSYNLNSTGGLPTAIPAGDPLLINLLWNSGEGPATPERVITEKISVLNKTLAYYDHWTVLEVSHGATSSTTFAEFLDQVPPVIINCDGTQTARITFTATDEDSKKVLPGTPFKVHSMLNQFGMLPMEHGFLQLDGDSASVDRGGSILSFNDHSEAYVLTRGESEAPRIGTIRLKFDNLRTVQPVFTYRGFLVGHRGPSIWQVSDGTIGIGGRLASQDGQTNGAPPKSVDLVVNPLDLDGNPFPGNYLVSYTGRGMGGTLVTAPLKGGNITISTPNFYLNSIVMTDGYDELHGIPTIYSDVIDIPDVNTADEYDSDLTNPNRNMRVVAYGNPWEQGREDWTRQRVTVERPHRLTDLGPNMDGWMLPLKTTNWDLSVLVWNNLVQKGPVEAGWQIRWKIFRSNPEGDTTLVDPTYTNPWGYATTRITAGTKWDIIQVVAWYDIDGDGLVGFSEPYITTGDIYVGLNDVTGIEGTAYQDLTTGENYVILTWPDVAGATAYELQQNGNTISTNATSPYRVGNLNPATTYTFGVRAVNGPNTSQQWKTVQVTTLAAPVVPATPTGLRVTGRSQTSISLDWDTMTGATAYDLERSADGGITWSAPWSITPSNYQDVGLTANTEYTYHVRSVSNIGSSEWSAPVTISTMP